MCLQGTFLICDVTHETNKQRWCSTGLNIGFGVKSSQCIVQLLVSTDRMELESMIPWPMDGLLLFYRHEAT